MKTDLQKSALAYIAEAQPMLDRLTERQAQYVQKAAGVAPVFVRCGLVDAKNEQKFAEKLASDPTVALEYLVKLAELSGSVGSELGQPVAKEASAGWGPFERWIYLGDPNANPEASSSAV